MGQRGKIVRGVSICVLGEVLWDVFPNGDAVLGGAPLNVAWHLQAFGHAPTLVAAYGDDPLGAALLQRCIEWGLDCQALRCDPDNPTGTVTVRLSQGEPRYSIAQPAAWDHMLAQQLPPLNADWILIHGSLAARSSASAHTLEVARQSGAQIFFDVNLRAPFWRFERVDALIRGSTWLKLNIDEWVALDFGPATVDAQSLMRILERYHLQQILLTMGEDGAWLMDRAGGLHRAHARRDMPVVDTIGAGDMFSAAYLDALLRGDGLQQALEYACDWAARITQQVGALPTTIDFYRL